MEKKEKIENDLFEDVPYNYQESVSSVESDDVLFEDIPYQEEMSPLTGTLVGGGIGQAIKSGASSLEKPISTAIKGAKNLPVIGEFIKSAEFSEQDKGVVGKKARESIIKESENLAEDISTKLDTQKKTASKKIGKVIELVDKKLDPTNVNQSLNQIEKSISSIKPPTEEGQKAVQNLQSLLDEYKQTKSEYSVKSKGIARTGVEEATQKLEDIKSKMIMEAEQLGEQKSFGPNKVVPEAKRVGSLDIQSGKFISTPIKSGEFSPIEISKKDTSFFQKMSTSDLKDLERGIREIKDSAATNTQAYSEAIKAENKIKEAISERVQKGLGQTGTDIYKSGIKEYSDAMKAQELFPELTKGDIGKINTSDFIRKVGDSTMTADSKKQILNSLFEKIKDNPKKLEEAKETIFELSDRYNLSHLSTKYGIDTSMLRNISVRAGDVTGKTLKYSKPLVKAIVKQAPWIGSVIGFLSTYEEARAEGSGIGESLLEAGKEEGVDIALGPLALFKPDKTGPRKGTPDYEIENRQPMSKEQAEDYYKRTKEQHKKLIKQDPNKIDLNVMADSFEQNGGTTVANQLRNIQNQQDIRRKKAKLHFLINTPAYKAVESSIDKNIMKTLDSFYGKEEETQGEQNENDTDANMSSDVSGIDSKKKVENTREPQGSFEEQDYFYPQTKKVQLDGVDENLLRELKEVSKKLGYDKIQLSSGVRGTQKTIDLLNQRKEREGISNLKEEENKIIDKILLRGNSPKNIEYPKGNWYEKAMEDLKSINRTDLIDEIIKIRKDFGGYESGHLQGKKVDIPYSFFVSKYGKEEGTKKAQEFIKALKDSGFSVIDERRAGVIDIKK